MLLHVTHNKDLTAPLVPGTVGTTYQRITSCIVVTENKYCLSATCQGLGTGFLSWRPARLSRCFCFSCCHDKKINNIFCYYYSEWVSSSVPHERFFITCSQSLLFKSKSSWESREDHQVFIDIDRLLSTLFKPLNRRI